MITVKKYASAHVASVNFKLCQAVRSTFCSTIHTVNFRRFLAFQKMLIEFQKTAVALQKYLIVLQKKKKSFQYFSLAHRKHLPCHLLSWLNKHQAFQRQAREHGKDFSVVLDNYLVQMMKMILKEKLKELISNLLFHYLTLLNRKLEKKMKQLFTHIALNYFDMMWIQNNGRNVVLEISKFYFIMRQSEVVL